MQDKEIQIGKYKIKIVRKDCIGAASCIAVSPAVFQLDSENKAVFLEGASDEEANILAAAQACPTRAIIITDAQTGKQIWPE